MNMVFKITDNQISAFEKDAEEKYFRDLVKFLQDEVPGAAEEDHDYLLGVTKAMVKKAADYGLKTKRDAAIYVTTAYLLGLDFEEHFHVAKEILTSSLPGMDKANWLQDAAVALIDSKGR